MKYLTFLRGKGGESDTKTNYESNSDGTSFLWAYRKCFFLKMYMPLKITYLDLRFRCAV